MIKKSIFYFFIFTSHLYSFQADCTMENQKHIHLEFKENLLIVDWKYKIFYKGKYLNWEEYENKGFIYKIKEPFKDGFLIKIKNKKIPNFINGICIL